MDISKIVGFIKQNNGTEIASLQREFSISYKSAKGIVDDLLKKGELVYSEGVRYDVVASSLLKPGGESGDRRRTVFEAKRAAESRAAFTESTPLPAKKKGKEGGKTDEDLLAALQSGMEITPQKAAGKEGYCFTVEGLKIGLLPVKLYMYLQNGKYVLTDGGAAMTALSDKMQLGAKVENEQIARIVDRYGLTLVGDELQVFVTNPREAVARLMLLYAGMEAIYSLHARL